MRFVSGNYRIQRRAGAALHSGHAEVVKERLELAQNVVVESGEEQRRGDGRHHGGLAEQGIGAARRN